MNGLIEIYISVLCAGATSAQHCSNLLTYSSVCEFIIVENNERV